MPPKLTGVPGRPAPQFRPAASSAGPRPARVYSDHGVTSTALVSVDRPQRYVKQLVGHLAHKRTTRLVPPDGGTVEWPDGRCDLVCEPGVLRLAAGGDGARGLA